MKLREVVRDEKLPRCICRYDGVMSRGIFSTPSISPSLLRPFSRQSGSHNIYAPRPTRWPQIGLKGFFTVVTLLCVWLGVQVKWIRDRHDALKVYRDENLVAIIGGPAYGQRLRWATLDENPKAPWPIRILGEKGVLTIIVGPRDSARDMTIDEERRGFDERKSERERLQRLFPEAHVVDSSLISLPR